MKIAGLIKTSLIDFPGNIAAVVFTQGCNFRCGFCHNPDLLDIQQPEAVSEENFFEFLKERQNILDGVVITGGEPTLQTDLIDFIKKIRELGFKVKLDTNGTNPKVLKSLIDLKLIDYVAMDIKGPLESYKKICGPVNLDSIKKSLEILQEGDVAYEFRTTVLPYYHSLEDFELIGQLVNGAPRYVVQGFRPEITYLKELSQEKPFTIRELQEIKNILKKHVKEVDIFDNM